ncbi:Cupin domain protein [Aspergillus sclerotialis]|uniref:Cupin domain protein n=1 Tax=Aspergillus sclerotialis TaxID=2070753 RepID=A0A3A2ZSV1_9EURO|nr:Cupin domain protein [Aspergillus sclerotialis]
MTSPTVITTTHNSDGLSVFRDNPVFKSFSTKVGIVYSTADNGPVTLSNDKDLADHEARNAFALIPTQGSVVLVAEWPPGTEPRMHRTLSVDVGVMIAGEIELLLDSGETRVLKQGDVLIHRGTMHGWRNRSATETARMVCFVLPSEPIPGVKD